MARLIFLVCFFGHCLVLCLADIAIAVVDLMQELTDVDTLNESEEDAAALVDALVCSDLWLEHES